MDRPNDDILSCESSIAVIQSSESQDRNTSSKKIVASDEVNQHILDKPNDYTLSLESSTLNVQEYNVFVKEVNKLKNDLSKINQELKNYHFLLDEATESQLAIICAIEEKVGKQYICQVNMGEDIILFKKAIREYTALMKEFFKCMDSIVSANLKLLGMFDGVHNVEELRNCCLDLRVNSVFKELAELRKKDFYQLIQKQEEIEELSIRFASKIKSDALLLISGSIRERFITYDMHYAKIKTSLNQALESFGTCVNNIDALLSNVFDNFGIEYLQVENKNAPDQFIGKVFSDAECESVFSFQHIDQSK